MRLPVESDYLYDEKLSQNELYHLVSREAVHFEQLAIKRKGTKEGDAQINRAIVRLLWNVHLVGMPPPGALVELIELQLGTFKRSRSLPRSIGKEQAAWFLAKNPNAPDRAVARGANAQLEELKQLWSGKGNEGRTPFKEWANKPLPKVSDHSVKKWREEKKFQQLVSEYRKEVKRRDALVRKHRTRP